MQYIISTLESIQRHSVPITTFVVHDAHSKTERSKLPRCGYFDLDCGTINTKPAICLTFTIFYAILAPNIDFEAKILMELRYT